MKVKLITPANKLWENNIERVFAKSFIDNFKEICLIIGPKAVNLLSNDNKVWVALGLAATSLKAPMLMDMDYRVGLPDHIFVVTPRHTLIPSIYGVCDIDGRELWHIREKHLSVCDVGNTIRHQRSYQSCIQFTGTLEMPANP